MRVLIADPDSVSRRGVRRILSESASCELVGEAADANGVAQLVDQTDPDVVVLSHEMDLRGGTLVSWLASDIGTAVILTAVTTGGPTVWRGISDGAVGYLLKDRMAGELELALEAAEGGGTFVSPPLARQLIRYIAARFGRVGDEQADVREIVRSLLPREQETLYRLAAGQSTDEIAKEMSVAAATVRAYVSRILTKLGLRNRGEAVALAFRSGFYRTDQINEISIER
jgi:DNA-binding NarL/FixJ family response regulator